MTPAVLDAFTHVLGDFTSTKSILKNNHPTVPLINPATGEVTNPNYPKNTPDHIFVQGELASGALASISFRKVAKPVDELGLRWLISGTKGEIEVTMPEGHVQQSPMGRTIRLRSGKEGEAQVVPWEDTSEGEHITGVPQVGENTARMYEDYATGGNGLMDFEGATRTHRLLNQILKESGYKY